MIIVNFLLSYAALCNSLQISKSYPRRHRSHIEMYRGNNDLSVSLNAIDENFSAVIQVEYDGPNGLNRRWMIVRSYNDFFDINKRIPSPQNIPYLSDSLFESNDRQAISRILDSFISYTDSDDISTSSSNAVFDFFGFPSDIVRNRRSAKYYDTAPFRHRPLRTPRTPSSLIPLRHLAGGSFTVAGQTRSPS